MKHTCYHLISDLNNEFLNDLKDVKTTVKKWKEDGESYIKIFRIMTEELGSDAINLEEKQLDIEDLNKN